MLQNEQNIAILRAKIDAGEISTTIRPQVQARHIEGTEEFERYRAQRLAKGQTPQSVMTIMTQEAQEFVDSHAGTGTVVVQIHKSGALKIVEFTNADRVIGRYYKNNAYHDTKRAGIYYSKKGVHVVPTEPKENE